MKRLCLCTLSMLALMALPARAEISKEKQEEITKMLKVTGMEKMATQMMSQMISSFKAQDSSVPDAFWTKFAANLDTHALIEKFMPIYDKHYSLEDMKAINAFYATPAGQHMLSSMPQVMQESMTIGQERGKDVAAKVMKALEEEKGKKAGK